MGIGIMELFWGQRFKKTTIGLVSFFMGFGICIAIFGEFCVTSLTEDNVVFVMLGVSFLFGILLMYTSLSVLSLGYFLQGSLTGIIIAFLLNNAFLHRIPSNNDYTTIWVSICIFGGLFGLGSFCVGRFVRIFSTSLIGAYCIIRPFGWIVGNYPNEFTIAKEVSYGKIDKIKPDFYLYFILTIILSILGMYCQYNLYQNYKKENGNPDEEPDWKFKNINWEFWKKEEKKDDEEIEMS